MVKFIRGCVCHLKICSSIEGTDSKLKGKTRFKKKNMVSSKRFFFFFKGNGNETRRSFVRSFSTDSTDSFYFFLFSPDRWLRASFSYRPFLSCVCAATAFPVSTNNRLPLDYAPVVQGWRNHGTERVLRDRKNRENIGFYFDAMRVSLCKDTWFDVSAEYFFFSK